MRTSVVLMIAWVVLLMIILPGAATDDGPSDSSSDPALLFSTFFGATTPIYIGGLIELDDGSLLFYGNTVSDLPVTQDAYCSTLNGGSDIYICRMNANASKVLYLTYIGGSTNDSVSQVLKDANGDFLLWGGTNSIDFPITPDAYCSTMNGDSASYIMKMDPNFSRIIYSTYIGGGSDTDAFQFGALGPHGNLYITGHSYSEDFPTTPGAFCRTHDPSPQRDPDVILFKFNITRNDMDYSTYIGGQWHDWANGISVDEEGCAYLAGTTQSDNFPVTPGAYSTHLSGYEDVYYLKMSSDGSQIEMCTFFGGSGYDGASGLALDGQSVWISGWTDSPNLPTTDDALDDDYDGLFDAILVRLSIDGSTLEYSTYFGSSNLDMSAGLALSPDGDPLMSISTRSDDVLLPRTAYDKTFNGTEDIFLMWFDGDEGRILNATYLGGSEADYAYSMTFSSDGHLLMTGLTTSSDFPLSEGCFDDEFSGVSECFLLGLDMQIAPWEPPPAPENLVVNGDDHFLRVEWDPDNGESSWPIASYNVYLGVEEKKETFYQKVTSDTKCLCSGLENGKTYYLTVTAVSVAGEGARANSTEGIPFGIPIQPGDVTADGRLDHVFLSWEEPGDTGGLPILGYRIFRSEDTTDLQHLYDTGNVVNYMDHAVEIGTQYYYQIQAFHSFANGTFSVIRSAEPYGMPGPPTELHAETGDMNVILAWLPPVSNGGLQIEQYKIYRGPTQDDLESMTRIDPSLSYLDGKVATGFTYYYAISAINTAIEGELSAIVSVLVTGPSSPPQVLTAEVGDGEIGLSWEPPRDTGGSPVIEYYVYQAVGADEFTLRAKVGLSTTYMDTGLDNGKEYRYLVRAVTSAGLGESTPAIDVTPCGEPGMPESFTITEGLFQVELIWLPPQITGGSEIDHFKIYRGETSSSMVLLLEVDNSLSRYTDLDVVAGVIYYYHITAANARFEGEATEILSAMPYGPPGVPQDMTGTVEDGVVTVIWTPPLNTGGLDVWAYVIYVGTSSDNLESLGNIGNRLSYTVEELANGVEYFLAVAAVNEAGEGPHTEPIVLIPIGPPSAPRGLVATVNGSNVFITWSSPLEDGGRPIVGYTLMRGVTPEDLEDIAMLEDVLTYLDEDVERGTTYFYSVIAVNEVGRSDLSDTIEIYIKPEAKEKSPGFVGVLVFIALGTVAVISIHRRGKIITLTRSRNSGRPMGGAPARLSGRSRGCSRR